MQEIKDRFTIKNIIFAILILLVIKFIFAVKNLALLVFASFVIAASLNPFVDKLQKYMNRAAATIVDSASKNGKVIILLNPSKFESISHKLAPIT